MWTQYVNRQAPMMQTMMSNYIEQSKNLFVQMQENMQQQARSMFTDVPVPAARRQEVAGDAEGPVPPTRPCSDAGRVFWHFLEP
jgi:hypothetical protein